MRTNASILCGLGGALFLAVTLCTISALRAQQDVASLRQSHLEKMSATDKDQLLRKLDRFNGLPKDEQEKLRQLESDLSSDPHGDRLRDVMSRYHKWLRSLPSGQRFEILGLPVDQRVVQIKQALIQQEDQRRQELANSAVSREDIDVVRRWFGEAFRKKEAELIEALPPAKRDELANWYPWRMGAIMGETFSRLGLQDDPTRYEKVLNITDDDIAQLVNRLSPTAQEAYRQQPSDGDRRKMVQNWIRATTGRGFRSMRVLAEDLRKYETGLDRTVRDRLDLLPPDQRRAELERMYHFDLAKRFSGERPGFGGKFGPRGKGFDKRREDEEKRHREKDPQRTVEPKPAEGQDKP